METKVFKINIPEGFEIDKVKSTLEEVIFKPIPKKELPKSWKELEDIDGFYVENCSVIEPFAVLGKVDRNIFPTFEKAEAAISLAQLCQLHDIYNEGWKPNWRKSETKHCIQIFRGEHIKLDTCMHCCQVLCFKIKDIAEKFSKNFKDLILQAKTLL